MLWTLVLAAVIPPGQEDAIARLLHEAALPDGCRAADVRVRADRIETPLSCPSGALRLQLLHPEAHASLPRTPHFAVRLVGDAPEGLGRRIALALAPHDQVDVWARPRPQARPTLPPVQRATIAAALSLWPLAELARWMRRRRPARTEDTP